MKNTISGSPFAKCEKGHDLTKERAFIYDNMNKRICRECATANMKGKKVRSKGSFV